MDKEIFDFEDYRAYLNSWIKSQPKNGRGMRALLAKDMSSPVSHISQVLKGLTHFTFEQGEEINSTLGHTAEQAEFFLLLLQFGRAGTPKLKNRLREQIHKVRTGRLILKKRLEVKTTLNNESQAMFYSSWHYTAIHILLTIPQFQTKETVSKALGLSLKRTNEMLEFMLSLGLIELKSGRYTVGTTRVHLGSDSPMISKHHINWRLQAIQSLEKEDFLEQLHYSSVVSIAKDDVLRIKAILVKAIENAKNVIRDSKEEELHSFCLDFFKVL